MAIAKSALDYNQIGLIYLCDLLQRASINNFNGGSGDRDPAPETERMQRPRQSLGRCGNDLSHLGAAKGVNCASAFLVRFVRNR